MSAAPDLRSSRWFAVQAKPRQEEIARAHLEGRGIEPYLPLWREKLIRGRRKVQVLRPLFPGYLFARFDPQRSLDRVRWCVGVQRLVGSSEGPIPLPEGVVEAIRRRAGRQGYLVRRFRAGERVKIRTGPFQGFVAVVQSSSSDKERVQVLLDLFQRQTRLDLDEAYLIRV